MANVIAPHRRDGIGVALVDGEPAVRRARQIMLRSENYDVRSYPTCEALLADPRSRACSCIVVDVHMIEIDGTDLLRKMRTLGWQGRGILLDGNAPDRALLSAVLESGDTVLKRTISDRALSAAIDDAVSQTL